MAKDDDGLTDLDSLAPPGGDPPEDLDDQDNNEPDNPDDFDDEADEERAGGEDPDALAAVPPADKSAQQPSRGDRRIKALRDRESATQRQLAEANRRIDELIRMQRQPFQPPQPVESAAQREARRSQMSPEEKIREDMAANREEDRRLLSQVAYGNADATDRMLYEAKAAANPTYKRWQAQVEKVRQEYLAKGVTIERETILRHEIGKAMLEQQGGRSKQREAAARRVKANQTKPGNARSDTAANRRQSGRTLEERLSDVPL